MSDDRDFKDGDYKTMDAAEDDVELDSHYY